jgi:opacity protein-like surface antigen
MKRALPLVVLVLLAALVVFPGPAQGEMYVEGYVGAVQGSSETVTPNYGGSYFDGLNTWATNGTADIPGRFDTQVIGGLKLGYWFTKEGFLGYDYPAWAKYFGVYLDLSFHKLDYRRQGATYSESYAVNGVPWFPWGNPVNGQMTWWSEGKVFTVAFMFAGRYGFLKDSEVPFGRLQPYIAVGPAIMISSQKRGFALQNVTSIDGTSFTPPIPWHQSRDVGTDTSVDIALAVEGGVRYMALKNVSIDVSFKYRYAEPSYDGQWMDTYTGGLFGNVLNNSTIRPTYHLFSGQIGVAYHF